MVWLVGWALCAEGGGTSIPSAEREQNVGIWCRNNRFHCINWATSNNTPMSKVHQGRQSAQRIWKEFRSDKSVCKRDFGHIILGWLLLPSLVMLDHRGQTNASCQLHWSERESIIVNALVSSGVIACDNRGTLWANTIHYVSYRLTRHMHVAECVCISALLIWQENMINDPTGPQNIFLMNHSPLKAFSFILNSINCYLWMVLCCSTFQEPEFSATPASQPATQRCTVELVMLWEWILSASGVCSVVSTWQRIDQNNVCNMSKCAVICVCLSEWNRLR